jgi:mono/diheme cytochrome c family protein
VRKQLILVVSVALASTAGLAQQTARPAEDASYTEVQAKRGEALFTENCAGCHGTDLAGDPYAPPLAGPAFVARWNSRPAGDLLDLMRATMPQTAPGGLSRQQNADLLAFILQKNGAAAGRAELPSQADAIAQLRLHAPAPSMPMPAPVAANPPPAPPRLMRTGEGFYTVGQAERGRAEFNRWCTPCHLAEPGQTTMSKTGRGFWLGSQHLMLQLGGRYAHKYPSTYHLYRRVRDTMPSFNADAIGNATKVDIVAYLLQQNGYPPGPDELTVDVTRMKTMKLAGVSSEAGFEPLFNGKDFTGIGILLGPNCRPQPQGCGRTTPDGIFSVQNGELVTTGKIQGYWYTEKKYLNFTLRFEFRFPRPVDLDPDDEYYDGNSGYLLFITEHRVWPRGIEIQGNNMNLLSAIGMDSAIKQIDDDQARKKAYRPVGQWSTVEIVSKDGQVKSYLNGVLINTVTEHPFKEPGHIAFQSEGVELHWRNIRVKPE